MITNQQNRQLHAQLTALGLMSQKSNLVHGITNGRTEKSSEMSNFECNELLAYLRTQQPAIKRDGQALKEDRMRKKILSMAWEMNWTESDAGNGVKVNVQRVDQWCKSYGYLKKPLNKYTYQELPKLVSQFENVYNSYLADLQKPSTDL